MWQVAEARWFVQVPPKLLEYASVTGGGGSSFRGRGRGGGRGGGGFGGGGGANFSSGSFGRF